METIDNNKNSNQREKTLYIKVRKQVQPENRKRRDERFSRF